MRALPETYRSWPQQKISPNAGFKQKQEGAKALTDYQAKEQATRLLTAKLRAERLARESKPRRKRKRNRVRRDPRHIYLTRYKGRQSAKAL